MRHGWENGPGGFEHFQLFGPLFALLFGAVVVLGKRRTTPGRT